MKKIIISLAIALNFFIWAFPSFGQGTPPVEGGILPKIILPVPADQGYKKYLGLKGEGTFLVPQLKAKVVLIEIFSMYCPHCQKDAPVVNDLFSKITGDDSLKNNIKLIGIGAGNSDFEVDFFRKTYNITFPMFSDAEFSIHKILGEVRTPYFIAIKINPSGTYKVVYSKLGGVSNADEFLKTIKKLAGLK
ncbi:MAG: TlpA family protein disulfide reductase [Proteobacteria bacterium]|nr:TlpA family protein disulfide reductase [Pseudomonadota bacterium]MBU4583458.1 TlpA family protein disulfide reductase [Pseudomonadota bacterium]